MKYLIALFDGFVIRLRRTALRCILRFFNVRKVRIITQDLRRLANFIRFGELFPLPSKVEFLRDQFL